MQGIALLWPGLTRQVSPGFVKYCTCFSFVLANDDKNAKIYFIFRQYNSVCRGLIGSGSVFREVHVVWKRTNIPIKNIRFEYQPISWIVNSMRWVAHVKQTVIGSDNGLSPAGHEATILTNIVPNEPLPTSLSQIWIKMNVPLSYPSRKCTRKCHLQLFWPHLFCPLVLLLSLHTTPHTNLRTRPQVKPIDEFSRYVKLLNWLFQ